MKKIICIILCAGLVFCSTKSHFAAAEKTAGPRLSTWVWNTPLIKTEQNQLITFFKSKGVSTVYLQINRDVPTVYYAEFIELAGQSSIEVFALEGSASWLNAENKRKELFFSWLNKYQQSASNAQKFAGIHLDIEPYSLKEWKSEYQNTVKKYQDTVSTAKEEANLLGLPLTMDIPFWFDERTYTNNVYGKGILSEWVTKVADGITLMAYRDSLEGNNGLKKLVQNELSFAAKTGKKAEIALETKPLANQDYLTFYEEGNKALMKTISQLNKYYSTNKGFQGTAVHSYEYWQKLRK